MQPSVLYTSSSFSRRYTLDGHTYRQGFVSQVRHTSVSTVMNGSSSNSNLSRPTRSSTLRGFDASGFAGSGIARHREPGTDNKPSVTIPRYQERHSGGRSEERRVGKEGRERV